LKHRSPPSSSLIRGCSRRAHVRAVFLLFNTKRLTSKTPHNFCIALCPQNTLSPSPACLVLSGAATARYLERRVPRRVLATHRHGCRSSGGGSSSGGGGASRSLLRRDLRHGLVLVLVRSEGVAVGQGLGEVEGRVRQGREGRLVVRARAACVREVVGEGEERRREARRMIQRTHLTMLLDRWCAPKWSAANPDKFCSFLFVAVPGAPVLLRLRLMLMDSELPSTPVRSRACE